MYATESSKWDVPCAASGPGPHELSTCGPAHSVPLRGLDEDKYGGCGSQLVKVAETKERRSL